MWSFIYHLIIFGVCAAVALCVVASAHLDAQGARHADVWFM